MHQYRRDPYPWTWEPAVAGLLGFGLVVAVSVHLGRAAACLVTGVGTCWVEQAAFLTSVWGVLSGDASAGLAEPVEVPRRVLMVSIALTVGIVLVLTAMCLVWVIRRWGNGALKGVASVDEVERLLGRRRLFRVRGVVRPDLYGHRHPAGDREPSDATV